MKDINGWYIPRRGQVTREIYDLLITGKTSKQIAKELQLKPRYVSVRVFRIKGKGIRTGGRGCRNSRGWLIPTLGTKRREVYDLLMKGHKSKAIQARAELTKQQADRHINRIKNAKRVAPLSLARQPVKQIISEGKP